MVKLSQEISINALRRLPQDTSSYIYLTTISNWQCTNAHPPKKNKQTNKMMLKVSNRNTRKSCLLISKIKSIRTTSPDYSLFAGGNCPDPYLGHFFLEYIPICNQNLLSVLFLSLAAHNFNNSRPVFVILWEMRNHYRNIWFMKNSKCHYFLFLKKQPQKWTDFSTFYLIFKGPSFQNHKVGHPNFL